MVSSVALAEEDFAAMSSELRMAGQCWQINMMFYTYIIESLNSSGKKYIGHTSNLKQRVLEHNTGKCVYTARYAPWKLKTYIAFETIERAQRFELYLKSGSGHAFASRHF